MDSRLLPFKYACLPFSFEYQKNKLIQLGWKLRKYQNWQDVYSQEDDKRVMREFADKAIDEGQLAAEYMSNIHAILLNVKKWSIDKENMHEVEAPHREDWDFLNTRLAAIEQNSAVAVKILKEYYPEEGEIFQRHGVGSAVSRILLARLINKSFKKTNTLSTDEYFDCPYDEFINILFNGLQDSIEYKVLSEATNVFQCCELMGVPNIGKVVFPELEEVELKIREVVFTEGGLDKFRLFQITSSAQIINVVLNSRHRYYLKIKDSSHFDAFKEFLSAYVLAHSDMPASQAGILEDFGFYLSKRLEEKSQR